MKIEIPYSKKLSIREELISKVLRFNKIPVVQNDPIRFNESVVYGTNASVNRSFVIKSMIKGDVRINESHNSIVWNLNVSTLVFKVVIFFLFTGFLAYVPFDNELWAAALVGLIFATILFVIVWLNLKGRIIRITNQIIQHASNHAKK